MKTVTVLIPTYNYAHYIQNAIDSILDSNFPQEEIEIITIDDGSTDNTRDVIGKYTDRVRYIYQENKGKYIFNLDADDFFLPNKISEVVKIFEMYPDVVHVGHPAIYWNEVNGSKQTENIPNDILGKVINGKSLLSYFYQNNILFGGGSTFAGRADALKSFTIPQSIDMYIDEFLVLFTANQGNSFLISEPLSIWRIHGKNFSANTDKAIRNLSSMKAVRDSILAADFSPDIKEIYTLKTKVADIAYKEAIGQKSVSDILDLWIYVARDINHTKINKLSLIKNYTIINRTLPVSLLNLLKSIKVKLLKKEE
jgi:glycosyltransferase involved in cell wall biosynthesis